MDSVDKFCPHCNFLNSITATFCNKCTKILPIIINNYFEYFNLPPSFELNKDSLEQVFFKKLQQVHPDKFIDATSKEKDIALEHASFTTNAYEVLKSPFKRAEYILKLNGIEENGAASLDEQFLTEVMEWREQLHNTLTLSECKNLLKKLEKAEWKEVIKNLNTNCYQEAHKHFVKIKFMLRFIEEINLY